MLADRTFPVFIKSIYYTGFPEIDLFDQFIQHRLGGGLVRGQRFAALDAVFIAVASPPELFQRKWDRLGLV